MASLLFLAFGEIERKSISLCKKLAKERSGNMDVSIFLELSNLLHLHSGSKQLQIHKKRS